MIAPVKISTASGGVQRRRATQVGGDHDPVARAAGRAHTPPNSSSATSGSDWAPSTSPRSVAEPVGWVMNSASATITTRSPIALAGLAEEQISEVVVAQDAQVRTHDCTSRQEERRDS